MTLYERLSADLKANAQEFYARFHKKLLKNDNIRVMGVRVPVLRNLAKKYFGEIDALLALPDDCYEVTFIKLTAVSYLPYGQFVPLLDDCVRKIDNWATCDCFRAKCIASHKRDFLFYIEKYLAEDKEFYQRFALTTLLAFYVGEEYLDTIFDCVTRADTSYYYVHMAAAWLIAEALVKYYPQGTAFLAKGTLDKRTHNKAIQKARESYRLSEEQKNLLLNLKR